MADVHITGDLDVSRVKGHVSDRAQQSVQAGLDVLYERAQAIAPTYDDTLKNTARTQAEGNQGILTYDHEQAHWIHEAVTADIRQGEAEWLKTTLENDAQDIFDAVGRELGLE